MLRHLRVTNFAILSDVTLELGPGMNVLTGETGAGKSLIVEAVNLLRGGRASADIPRAGADEAVVEAIVEVPVDLRARVGAVLDAGGLPRRVDDGDGDGGGAPVRAAHDGPIAVDEVFIRRIIQRGGRSRTYVNGALTTAARLAELGALLIDLSGQHQHQGLVDPGRHREILDLFAATLGRAGAPGKGAGRGRKRADDVAARPESDARALAEAMAAAWDRLRTLDDEITTLTADDQARAARIDYLRFQVEELDAIAPQAGEDRALEAERTRLVAVDQLQAGISAAEHHLYAGDDSAVDRLATAIRELDRLGRVDTTLAELARPLVDARALVEDVVAQLRGYGERLEADPERLAQVDDRLAALRRLVRKHGGDLEAVVARADTLRAELAGLDGAGDRLEVLRVEQAAALAAATELATALTAARRGAAAVLEREVGGHLAELGMAAARLTVVVEERPLGPTGADRVELVLASNPGEAPRPLAKVASGGELSRIMLATKLALRRADEVATYVFDEVDTGVGGATATAVGAQIRAVADHRQVLCVTHLPQIAAFADHHFEVAKAEVGGRTETRVNRLSATGRKDALARLLGGQATARARAHAAEMLAEARKGHAA